MPDRTKRHSILVSQCETKFHIDFAAILSKMTGAIEFAIFELRGRNKVASSTAAK